MSTPPFQRPGMISPSLDRILEAMHVDVEAFAVCHIGPDACLQFEPGGTALHYVLEGTLHMRPSDDVLLTLGPGSVVLVPSGNRQRLCGSAEPERVYLADSVRELSAAGTFTYLATDGAPGGVKLVCGKINAVIGDSFGPFDRFGDIVAADLSDVPLVIAAFEEMRRETSDGLGGSKAIVDSLMKACLVTLIRRYLNRPDRLAAAPALFVEPRLGRALSHVLTEPAAKHSVATLANVSGMSRSAFAKAFVDALGVTPMEFVVRTRLNQALKLLITTDTPISTIASQAGFASRSHFTRLFRDSHGVGPTEYRKTRGSGMSGENEDVEARTAA